MVGGDCGGGKARGPGKKGFLGAQRSWSYEDAQATSWGALSARGRSVNFCGWSVEATGGFLAARWHEESRISGLVQEWNAN